MRHCMSEGPNPQTWQYWMWWEDTEKTCNFQVGTSFKRKPPLIPLHLWSKVPWYKLVPVQMLNFKALYLKTMFLHIGSSDMQYLICAIHLSNFFARSVTRNIKWSVLLDNSWQENTICCCLSIKNVLSASYTKTLPVS